MRQVPNWEENDPLMWAHIYVGADYDDWLQREEWHLQEGAQLVLGVEPITLSDGFVPRWNLENGWMLIMNIVRHVLRERTGERWPDYCAPLDFLAICRSENIGLPPELDEHLRLHAPELYKRKISRVTNEPNALRFEKARTEYLGAAVVCLSRWPQSCRRKNGEVNQAALRRLIDEKSKLFWPDTNEPPLGDEAATKLLRHYFRRSRS